MVNKFDKIYTHIFVGIGKQRVMAHMPMINIFRQIEIIGWIRIVCRNIPKIEI